NTATKADNGVMDFGAINFVFPFPTFRGSLVFGVGYTKERSLNNIVGFDGFNEGYNSMIQNLTFSNNVDQQNIAYYTGVSYMPREDAPDTTDIAGGLKQSGEYKTEGNIGKWAFSGAVEVAKNAFLGATLNLYTGSMKWNSDFYEDDIKNYYGVNFPLTPADPNTDDFRYFYYNQMLDWDISGYDLKLGFLVQPTKFARFGLSIKFPSTFTIKENYSIYGEASYGTGALYTTDDPEVASHLTTEFESEYDIVTPYVFTGGASFNVRGLILSGDVSVIDFTTMEFSDGLNEGFMRDLNKDIENSFRTVVNFNLGAEYAIPQIGMRLRGGFIYNPSPYEGDPSERDRKFVTGGIGLLLNESVALDAAYAHGWWKDIGDNYGSDVSRTFQDISVNNLIFTFSYRF
ncbi:MAG TPA: outer membrane protein transport protein, partial [Ignavibacteriales bacterium]|nr:outer membrane protein transport protein [Ignavibacteriales bacterium]